MDVLKAVQTYVTKMLAQAPGVKVLLLDTETTPIISLASTTSHLLSHEVYLTDRLDNITRERMPHLQCICFLRPSATSLAALEAELAHPRYAGYWLYFTNVLKKSAIERLAEADEYEVVKEVQEFFADYSPITQSHFSLNLLPVPLSSSVQANRRRLYSEVPTAWDLSPETGSFDRHVEGLAAVLLSLKKKPIIRYERMSPMARKLGQDLLYHISTESQLFDFRPAAIAPLLLILDRRNDPVTPLLSQWTYQAMVHDLIGINNGRVDLSGAHDVRDELKEIVLSPEHDPFFAMRLYDNFGDLGAQIKDYVDEYQSRSASSSVKDIQTVADMKRFIEEYPEFRKLGGNVSKHVALVGELSRLVEVRKLLEVSELEQSLASNESHGADLRSTQMMIASPDIPNDSKLRIAILYALRYQRFNGNAISQVVALLKQNGIADSEAALVHIMLNFAGADQRQDDLFRNENFFSKGKSALKGLKGVDNVYTQHTPHIAQTVELLVKGRLKEASYPYLDVQSIPRDTRCQDVILFIIGGTTYEEARSIAVLNQQFAQASSYSNAPGAQAQNNFGAGVRLLLGGTGVLNSTMFLDLVRDAAARFPASMTSSALSLRPTSQPPQATPQTSQEGLNLKIGNLSLNVGGNAGAGLEAGVDNVRDAAMNLFGRVRKGVNQL
ncbi:uncharacterized protein L969DRAFT_78767 [Mixia osmundae IAM 14324]|uniref:Vacuolar protein sorting-associated protein 45 n=1 Tax=Mixia osmundae (strain CBS 9802 / IAM 14324 / JCM 22182 / KY 12970) TaxID=764103 RepID=G7EB01_MIXOS|nr:uncharacterized protein L969DRAFT_78767 [Mixia osmundae IAM 14324]KEI37046.1 hypothetical protein L969DRAFT_78767 [Mixia osmundae IAM 14324]GAB00012.1 hypothetical protein E5Q_06714 [Mixia osmundae IAM 14324]